MQTEVGKGASTERQVDRMTPALAAIAAHEDMSASLYSRAEVEKLRAVDGETIAILRQGDAGGSANWQELNRGMKIGNEMVDILANEVSAWGCDTISEIKQRIYDQAVSNLRARGLLK
jgi:hypothetical protein